MFLVTINTSERTEDRTSDILLRTEEVCRYRESYFLQISEDSWRSCEIVYFPMKRVGQSVWVMRDLNKLSGGKDNLPYKYFKFWNWSLYMDLQLEARPYFVADNIMAKQCLVLLISCCIHAKLCQILNIFNKSTRLCWQTLNHFQLNMFYHKSFGHIASLKNDKVSVQAQLYNSCCLLNFHIISKHPSSRLNSYPTGPFQ